MAQQHLAPAAARFAEADQGFELAVLDPFLLLTGTGLIDEAAQLRDVTGAMGHPGHRGQAVAPDDPGGQYDPAGHGSDPLLPPAVQIGSVAGQ